MRNNLRSVHLELSGKALSSFTIERPTTLKVMAQSVWLTHSLCPVDYVLNAGQEVVLLPGVVLVEAATRQAARVSLNEPNAQRLFDGKAWVVRRAVHWVRCAFAGAACEIPKAQGVLLRCA